MLCDRFAKILYHSVGCESRYQLLRLLHRWACSDLMRSSGYYLSSFQKIKSSIFLSIADEQIVMTLYERKFPKLGNRCVLGLTKFFFDRGDSFQRVSTSSRSSHSMLWSSISIVPTSLGTYWSSFSSVSTNRYSSSPSSSSRTSLSVLKKFASFPDDSNLLASRILFFRFLRYSLRSHLISIS